MRDEVLIRLCEETVKYLSQTVTVNSGAAIVPSYNALLAAARGNHPGHPFLSALGTLAVGEDDAPTVAEVMALFAQVRVVLESLREPVRTDLGPMREPA